MAVIINGLTQIGRSVPQYASDLQLWLDASDSTTLFQDSAATTLAVNDGDPVGCWKDKSGYARHALQTDGTKKPLLKTSIKNSRNVILFDATNDVLTTNETWTINFLTIFTVVKSISFFSYHTVFEQHNHGDILYSMGLINSGRTHSGDLIRESVFAYQSEKFDVSSNDWKLYASTRNSLSGNRYTWRTDGVEKSRDSTEIYGNPYTVNPRNLPVHVGAQNHNVHGMYTINGYIAELLLYGRVLQSHEINIVESYLNAKWGVY